MPDKETIEIGYSFVVPTWDDPNALWCTLLSIIMQSDKKLPREVIVVGDGYEEAVVDVCTKAQALAEREEQLVGIGYHHLKEHIGNGNIPRASGLQKATLPWVIFLDTGALITHNALQVITDAIAEHPEAFIVSWDMVQLTHPVPITTTIHAVINSKRENGLPYVLPGCAVAWRRDVAQSVEWPDTRASDWAYSSAIWETQFMKDGKEDEVLVNKSIVLIPWALSVSYARTKNKKNRLPLTMEQYQSMNYHMGFKQATAIKDAPDGGTINNTDAPENELPAGAPEQVA